VDKFFFVWCSMELILNIVSVGVHVWKGTWSKSESVVRSEKGSDESFSLWFVNFSSSIIIILSPEVVEVSSNVGINFVLLNNMKSSNDVCSPLGSWWFWKFPDTSSSSEWVSLFNSVSLKNIIHDIVLISTIALVRKMISVTCIRSFGRWSPWGFLLDGDSLGDW